MLKKLLAALLMWFAAQIYAAEPVKVVAAENFYGEIAQQIGGNYVAVTSILNNPRQDPHLFSTNLQTAKAVADADIVIYNGLGYDAWINNLINTSKSKSPILIEAAALTARHAGDNPHIWYDPQTMRALAERITLELSRLDGPHREYYQQQLADFNKNYLKLSEKIQQLRARYQGTAVIATEPVFNEMSNLLGLVMQGQKFQLSVMNDTEPGIDEVRDFEDALTHHRVKLFIYNNQVTGPAIERLRNIAQQAGIPQIGVSETQPTGQNYFTWMENQLNALDKALHNP